MKILKKKYKGVVIFFFLNSWNTKFLKKIDHLVFFYNSRTFRNEKKKVIKNILIIIYLCASI